MGGETRLLESNAQLGFGFAQHASTGEVAQAPSEERFLSGAQGDFFVGAQGLAEYLDAHQQGWVELTRFHRRGLAKVKVEFALHCAAYNLRKVALGGAGLALLFTLSIRSAHRWRLAAIAWIILPLRP